MPARRASGRKKSGRGTRTALVIAAAILVLFTFASLIFHYFVNRPQSTNYCGPLGYWLAHGLDMLFGWSSLFGPILLAMLGILYLRRGKPWRPFTGALVWTACLSTLAALVSYQFRMQPNLAGVVGGWFAGILLLGLGFGAYAVPALTLLWGQNIWRKRPAGPDLTQSGFVLLLGLYLDLFLAYFGGRWSLTGPLPRAVPYPIGGKAGLGIVHGLEKLVGPAGTLIILIGTFLIVLALFTKLRVPELGWLRAILAALFARPKRKPEQKPLIAAPSLDRQAAAAAEAAGPKPQPESPMASPGPPASDESDKSDRPEDLEPEPEEREPVVAVRPVEARREPEPVQRRHPLKFNLNDFQKQFLEALDQPGEKDHVFKDRRESEAEALVLIDKLKQFGIEGRISDIQSGPMITRFELEPAPGVKIQSISSRQDDISLALAAERIRILAPIPGKNAVGIEVPNKERRTVFLREVLTSQPFRNQKSPLGFALGTTITGEPYSGDLRTMPHILIAGTTGSGKSVCINSLIASIIYRSGPDYVRFLTIDPKQLELPVYNPIPHLLGTTTIDPDKAVRELGRVVEIMEARYGEFANLGVRDIVGYNERAEQEGFDRKPYIVVIIDELADLMLRAPNEIEMRITRLAQMSRAVGIHLVLATQRPSVDVITGLIKANFPCRTAFQVASKTDSRTILDMNGAESLLGRGDMLFLPPGKGEPTRLHGSFVSDRAAKRIVDLWARTYLTELLAGLVENPAECARKIVESDVVDVLYDREKSGVRRKLDDMRTILPEEVVDNLMSRKYYETLPEESPQVQAERSRAQEQDRERDEKFVEAAQIVVRHREASVSMLQRRLDIGWARAGRIIDQLEQVGVVGPYVGSKSRKVLVDNEADLQKVLTGEKAQPS
ncbi:DNA translocase FtsK 4TM domain-containing protein [candidate division WOR-3 bacterium]|nr:DNA translocase FtsK 4TM domain-containing protein [candidate division WOR-3 bacterium]